MFSLLKLYPRLIYALHPVFLLENFAPGKSGKDESALKIQIFTEPNILLHNFKNNKKIYQYSKQHTRNCFHNIPKAEAGVQPQTFDHSYIGIPQS